ncbi:hypothetical protein ACQ4PT_055202 [Festuca glaucescens]
MARHTSTPLAADDADEEEAPLWAALRRLPTLEQRARHAIVTLEDGSRKVADVGRVGSAERRALLARLLRSGVQEDNERFLLKLKDRIDRVGIVLPTVEVRFEHLNADVEVCVGTRGLPTVLNSITNIFEGAANALHILPSRKRKLPILHGISSIIKPRRMTLLLGPPGSGKTTFLLALAGRLGSDLQVSGKVTYNGHEMDDFVPERTAAYVSQHDLHIGEMTVRETLVFSARCQRVGYLHDLLLELLRREEASSIKPDVDIDVFMKAAALGGREANIVTEYILKILGLEACADTMVDEMFRGISGGQRKRVTTGEILVGSARALFMDDISTGLDSSTTFQIINFLRQAIHILSRTAVISLLQPSPETYNLFDDIILLSDGQVVYHGPRKNVLEFFESMGFRCPERKAVADFLQEIMSRKDQKQYWARHDQPYQYVSVKEFAGAFHLFHVGQDMANEIALLFDKGASHPLALTTSKYCVSTKELLKANVDREILLMKRNSFFYVFRIVQMFIEEVMALVELTTMRDALVGLPGVNGLSTEQRKRLMISVELVANPSIIFMDEPTSGLDARAAAIVMRTIRNTVDTGRTVVCTIHHPSIDIFESFDELFLMKQGGEEIYVGPLGHHSSKLIEYFEAIEGVTKIKDAYNPATWMLEVTTVSQEQLLGIDFSDIYKKSKLYQRNKALIDELSTPPSGSDALYFPTKHSRSFFTQCLACLWKQNLSYWRNPQYNAVRFFSTMIIALLFGTIFWDLGTKREKPQDLFNAMGSMYAAVLTIGVLNSASVQPVVAVERTTFYRERAAGMYSAFPYAFGQVAIEIPYTLVQSGIYAVIVYPMIWTVPKFFWYLFFIYFTLLYFTFYGMMAVGLTENHTIASIVSASCYAIWNLFSGFVIPRTKIPIWWRWYYWMCPVAWSLYGMVVSQYGDVADPLYDGVTTTTVARFVSDYFGFEYNSLMAVGAVVVAFGLLFAFLFGFAIMKLDFHRK